MVEIGVVKCSKDLKGSIALFPSMPAEANVED